MGAARLVIAVLVLGLLLLAYMQPWQPRILSFDLDRHTCEFDKNREEVVVKVSIRASTRGTVPFIVRAELLDRHDRDRQPYVASRRVNFDTDGDFQRRGVTLRISQTPAQWDAGHDQCVVTLGTDRG